MGTRSWSLRSSVDQLPHVALFVRDVYELDVAAGPAIPSRVYRRGGHRLTVLRPPTAADVVLLAGWQDEVESVFENFSGAPPPGASTAPDLRAGSGRLAVADDAGQLIGDVTWHAVDYGPNPGSRALDIGISLRAAAWGQGHGARAQRMLAAHLFATTAVNRVQASTDVSNRAERAALLSAGFALEGVARGAQWRGGQWHDMALYARLRCDPQPM